MRLFIAVLCLAFAVSASALPGTFSIDQVYSNADGTLQFVVIHDRGGTDCDAGENLWAGNALLSTGPSPDRTFVFPTNLPSCMTSGRSMLIATEGFAALGLVSPDYVIPNGFLQIPNGTVSFAAVSALAYSPLPTDGVNALYRDGTVRQNLATNFAGASASAAAAQVPTIVTIVEYHHASFDHYFITPVPAEIALLDAHAPPFQEWSRTGLAFNAYANAGAPAGTVGICRFFNTSFAPKSSHFYAAHGFGCEATLSLFPDWGLEDPMLFNTFLPDAGGACPVGSIPLYRLYNNGMGGAPNHRFVTSLTERQNMIDKGYVPEGNGIGVGMCVPSSAGAASSAQGIWRGISNFNQTVAGIVLDDGSSYFVYTQPGNGAFAGVVLGNATFNSGTFSAANARDFNITPSGSVINATVSGTYVQGISINGTIAEATNSETVLLAYDSRYEQPASLAAAAGTYSASVGSLSGFQNATLTLSTNGAIVGGGNGCTFTGVATPHGNVNVFDAQVTFNGGTCLFGTSTIVGVAFYDPAIRTIYGAAPNPARTDALLFIGTK